MASQSQNDSIQKLSIPQERPNLKMSNEYGKIPHSMIDKQVSQNNKNLKDKAEKAYKNDKAYTQPTGYIQHEIQSQNNLKEDKPTTIPQSPIDENQIVFQIDDDLVLDRKHHSLNNQGKQDEENPFSNIEQIENEQTAAMNMSECKKKQGSISNIHRNQLNDSLGPKLVLSRFALRKNEINLTTSIQQPFQQHSIPNKSSFQNVNSKENEQVMYSGSQGWMHSQFNPQLDNNLKKEIYVIQKMVEFQFDPVIAKGILEQIDIEKFPREELVQMVCETMLNHREEQRIGKRIIDKIEQSRFLSKIISPRNVNSSKNINNNNNIANSFIVDIPMKPSQNFQPACSIGNSDNSNNLNVPSGVGGGTNLNPNSFASKKGVGREKSPSKQPSPNKLIKKINSHIFSMPISHSQKYIKIENNVPDKVESKLYSCEICCMEYLGSEFYRITTCVHNFCMNCIQTYLIEKINKSEVLNITCPQYDCHIKLLDYQIQKVLHPDIFDRYMKFKKIMVLNQDPTIRWCPTLDCETYMRGEKEKPCMECPKCQKKMCYLCNHRWHEGLCEDAMNSSLVDIKDRLKIRSCPKCKGKIQKFEGCNHMKCWICSYEFCWLCKKQYTKIHYKSWNIIGCPDEKLEGMDQACSLMGSLLRLIFICILMIMGGTAALTIYILLMFILALVLPILIINHYFKPEVEKMSASKKCMLWLILFGSGIVFYPIWLFLCYIPGTCVFGPEIYMYILFIIYNEDMYE